MTTPKLKDDLILDEGLREHAYADGGGVWTIGVGHTGPDVRRGLVWPRELCLQTLDYDIAHTEQGLEARLSWWRTLAPGRQDVLVNMAFNLGVEGLLGFRHTLEAVRLGDYAAAGAHMLTSEPWRSQIGARAERLAEQMRTGVRARREAEP